MPDRREVLRGLSAGVAAGLLSGSARAQAAAPRIKIGQIGVGHAHAGKLGVFRESADYEVIGIVEPDAELRGQAEAQPEFAGLPWMTQEQLLNAPGLQMVLVETHVSGLLDAAAACVAAGKHVHLDKPAGESLSQYREILDAARAQKLLVQMGYMYRYNPGVVMLREFLARGWLGEPFEAHAVMSKQVDASARRRLGAHRGGLMFELGCHLIDLMVGVLGKPERVTPYVRHSSPLDDGLSDNMLAVLEYPRATATVRSTALEVAGTGRRHLVVCGSEGTFQIEPLDAPAVRVALSQDRDGHRRGWQEIKLPRYERYVDDAADMARVIRGDKEMAVGYDHDLAVQATLLAACGVPNELDASSPARGQ